MADQPLSDLTAVTTILDADNFYVVVGGNSRKVTGASIKALFAAAVHAHTLADVSDAGDLAALDTVDTAQLANDAVTQAKIANDAVGTSQIADGAVSASRIYTGSSTAPTPVAGVSDIDFSTLGTTVDFLIVADGDTDHLDLTTPAARRNVYVYNNTSAGNTFDVRDASDNDIVSSLPYRYFARLGWSGSNWVVKAIQAAALHQHVLSDISDAGTAAASDTGDFATAAQGATADTAVQPADLVASDANNDFTAPPPAWSGTETEYAALTPTSGRLYFVKADA